ncbi:PepSY domain-containing protein [Bradyrhizobium sp.]|uniref:PepSY domain-containing protein n=1 Tax=Bradyrhizobium sp. TaxID=376 RepID=UPI0039E5F8B2
MKLATFIIIGLLSTAGAARADQSGPDWMPAHQVKAQLAKAGYSNITEFEADDGHWEGEGVKSGRKMQFHADPKTGRIISEKPSH